MFMNILILILKYITIYVGVNCFYILIRHCRFLDYGRTFGEFMFNYRKIGVFISHIYGPYQRELCQGIIDKASSYGYRVEFFHQMMERILDITR